MADSIKFEIKATATGFDIVKKKQKELVKQTDQQAKSQNKAKKSGDNLDKQNKSLYQTNLAGSKDETTDFVAVGYNLGHVSVQAQYKDVENLAGTNGQDGKIFGLYLGTKF